MGGTANNQFSMRGLFSMKAICALKKIVMPMSIMLNKAATNIESNIIRLPSFLSEGNGTANSYRSVATVPKIPMMLKASNKFINYLIVRCLQHRGTNDELISINI